MEIQQIMEKNFKNVIVNGEEYPLSQTRKFLSYSVMAIQFLIFTLLILCNFKNILNSILPDNLIDWIGENKLRTFFITFFMGNLLQSNISNTGAFEIFYNGNQIWSKLNMGDVPNINQLIQMLIQNGANFIKV
jgi:selT/selW/selH-like putative selenoprotein